jgi:hypothetical protein
MLVKKSFLTSQESRTALQWVVSHVPAAAPTCHLRDCPPARSQSHVMSHNSARADEATRSNPTRPVAVPRSNLLAPACACSTSVNITPLQRPVAPPRDSHFERTCDARSARTSQVATRFTLGPPRTSEGFLPLPQRTHASFYACKRLLSAWKVSRAARAEPINPSIIEAWPSGSVAEL